MCDQLTAIGQVFDDSDKTHWFLCGLGALFETFSTAVRTSAASYQLRDLLAKAEGHEFFLKAINGEASSPPAVAFSVGATLAGSASG